jgi:ABC-type transporter Mla subunit MlaD
MPLQDLTPQLRTRLSRLERLVGWFITVATVLLLFGFVYYTREIARRKGWFVKKVPYFTFVQNAAGLKLGDPVKLMGFDAGQIVEITPQPPYDPYYNVFIRFVIREPYYGYLWGDSRAKVTAADFLGNRYIEVTKGTNGPATYFETNKTVVGVWDDKLGKYVPFTKETKGYFLLPVESPALTERLERVINTVEAALPSFLTLTNTLTRVLTNAENLTGHADELIVSARPVVTNLAQITENIRDPNGSLGRWLIPTNLNEQLSGTLASAHSTLNTAQTNLNLVSSNLNLSLENLANLTSNLNAQVQGNSLILTEISDLISHTDEMVQGLKRHWFLRSAFGKSQTNAPIESIVKPRIGGGK